MKKNLISEDARKASPAPVAVAETDKRIAHGSTPGVVMVLLQLLLLSGALRLNAGTHTWTGAAGDGKWSTAANWSGGAPAAGEDANVILQFPAAGTKRATNDLGSLTLDQIQISGDGYIIAGSGTGSNVTLRSGNVLSSTFFITGANSVLTNFTFTIATNVIGNASASVSSGDTATFRCRFTGPGGFVKRGNGTLILDGSSANTYAGRTEVHGGILKLAQTGNAIPGDLIIGSAAITNLAEVELLTPNQVADAADIFVNHNGTFTPGVFSETISSITISNADLVAGTGLTLGGNFTSIGTNLVTGTILLGGADRVFDVTGYLTANAFIANASGTAGITKTGPGTMELQRTNSYNGMTRINGGTLNVAHSGGLGPVSAWTIVNYGATLQVQSTVTLPPEEIWLYGLGANGSGTLILGSNSVVRGTLLLGSDAVSIKVAQSNCLASILAPVMGEGTLQKQGPGALQLAGNTANHFGGAVVEEGDLVLAKSGGALAISGSLTIGTGLSLETTARVRLRDHNQIYDHASVYVDAGGQLSLDGQSDYNDTIGSLTLRLGRISTGLGLLTLNGHVSVINHPSWPGYGSMIEGNIGLNGNPRIVDIATNIVLSVYGSVTDGGITSSLHKTGPGELQLWFGENSYSGETRIQQGLLELVGSRPGLATVGTVVQSGAALRLWDAGVTNESLTINGDGGGERFQAALHYRGNCTWDGQIIVASDATVLGQSSSSYGSAELVVSGQLTGPGNLRHREEHEWVPDCTFRLAGVLDNTMTGAIQFESGKMELNKSAGAVAISSRLIIGLPQAEPSATVRLLAPNQIGNGVVPYLRPSGLLHLGGFNDAVGGIEMDGGKIEGSGGTLTLLGDVWTRNIGIGYSMITAPMTLGGGMRTFHVGDHNLPAFLAIYSSISDGGAPGGIIVDASSTQGGSACMLDASNSFTGLVIVRSGTLMAGPNGALGSPLAGTIVSNNATLMVYRTMGIHHEPLILNGVGLNGGGALQAKRVTSATSGATNVWNGPITLGTEGSAQVLITTEEDAPAINKADLVISSVISGNADLRIHAAGRVTLAGTQHNGYSGRTVLEQGELWLAKTNATAVPHQIEINQGRVVLARDEQIANDALLWVKSPGQLEHSNRVETVARLTGDGTVSVGGGTLRLADSNPGAVNHFSGAILGTGPGTNLVKLGASTQVLSGLNPYQGTTHLLDGRLVVNGTNANSAIFVTNNAVLAGIGTVRDIIANRGTVAPGLFTNIAGSCYGKLTALGNVTFKPGAKLRVEIGGTAGGTNLDQLITAGQLNLAGGSIETSLDASGLKIGDHYTVVRTLNGNGAAGTFAGLPEAQIFHPSAGRSFQISYVGDDGNDIVLTHLTAPTPATMNGILKLGDGTIQIAGTGSPGLAYAVYATTDLASANWVNIGSITADGNGALEFIDNDAQQLPMRFYRFVLP